MPDNSFDRARLERSCRLIEDALRKIGGVPFLDGARAESERYVALLFPFDGCGVEPTERLRARVRVLADHLDRAADRGRTD